MMYTKYFSGVRVKDQVLWTASRRSRGPYQTAKTHILGLFLDENVALFISSSVGLSGPSFAYMCTKVAWSPINSLWLNVAMGRGTRIVVSTAAFHSRARGSVPGLGGLKETKCFFPIHV